MTPGQKQTIELAIANLTEIEEKYDVSVNQASTSPQGFIDYIDRDPVMDSSLKYLIKDIVKYEKEVTVPAGETVQVPFEIQMPDEQFDGQISAGIQVNKKSEENSGDAVTNQVGYVVGLKLTETDNPVKREIQLKNIKAAATYGKTSIVANLTNTTMDAIGKLKYVVDIKNEKNGESVKKITYDSSMEMAPNSTYGLAIDWDGKPLVAGDYVMDLVITDAKDNEWKFNEKFTITAKEASDINKVTVDVGKKVTPIWMYILIGMGILFVLGMIVVIFLKKKKKKKQQEMKKRRKANASNKRKKQPITNNQGVKKQKSKQKGKKIANKRNDNE